MTRAKGQTTNYGKPFRPDRPQYPVPKAGHVDSSTTRRDAAKFDEVTKTRLRKPPHRHRFEQGKCTVCNEPEVEST